MVRNIPMSMLYGDCCKVSESREKINQQFPLSKILVCVPVKEHSSPASFLTAFKFF